MSPDAEPRFRRSSKAVSRWRGSASAIVAISASAGGIAARCWRSLVLVRPTRFTPAEIVAANAEIQQVLANEGYEGLRSVGAGEHAVRIKLRADQERRAAALVARYGDLLDITVGYFPYPMPADRTSMTSDACSRIIVARPTNMQGL